MIFHLSCLHHSAYILFTTKCCYCSFKFKFNRRGRLAFAAAAPAHPPDRARAQIAHLPKDKNVYIRPRRSSKSLGEEGVDESEGDTFYPKAKGVSSSLHWRLEDNFGKYAKETPKEEICRFRAQLRKLPSWIRSWRPPLLRSCKYYALIS